MHAQELNLIAYTGLVTRERLSVSRWLLVLSVLGGTLTAISDSLAGNALTASIGVGAVAVSVIGLAIGRVERFAAWPVYITISMFYVMFVFVATSQLPFHGEKLAWAPLYPVAFFFLAGLRVGLLLSGTGFALALASFWLMPQLLGQARLVSGYEFSQGMGAFLTCAVFAYYYEYIRTRQARQLEALAHEDPLTGLLNRRGFLSLAQSVQLQSARSGEAYGLVLIDLDDFKKVNDTKGHDAGDILLRELGKLLGQAARKADVVARWGGEEFVVLMPQCSEESARFGAERLLAAIAGHAFTIGPVTASLGVAINRADESLDSVTNRADEALYRAKASGKNRVVMHGAA